MSPFLPHFYTRWLTARPAVEAPVLDCLGDCERLSAAHPFHEATKCCTYFPFLPNFSIGAMLAAGGAVKARVQIAMRLGIVTPLGLFPTRERESLTRELGPESFGRRLELACPLYNRDVGGCGIWDFRPGVCASYICREIGPARLEWEEKLNLFEWTLAHEVLWREGFLQDEIEATEIARSSGTKIPWFEKREPSNAFFEACARAAYEVSALEISALMGNV